MRQHRCEVDHGFDGGNAERGAGAHGMGLLCRRQQRLGGHAAIVQTVAAHLPLFEENHLAAELRGGSGNRETTRPRTDHRDIEMPGLHLWRSFHSLKPSGISATRPSAVRPRPSSGVSSAEASIENWQLAAPLAATQASIGGELHIDHPVEACPHQREVQTRRE